MRGNGGVGIAGSLSDAAPRGFLAAHPAAFKARMPRVRRRPAAGAE
ncbi:MAG TPA: hypothetical protein VMU81_01170 [Acetobacteraceae bacterium]|jgi:hypothetical protein|nr:hypothetical protein [Acetobacteraceae bacterium]